VHTWDTTKNVVYPERDDPQFRVPWLAERNVGVEFSGGGTRSAAATLGQLRALNCLGWLPSVAYFSSVSGGSWAAVPFTYLPADHADKQFLGDYFPPEKLTDDELNKSPDGSLTHAINHAWPFLRAITHWIRLRGDESYAASLNDIFLHPFGLGDRSKFFSFDEAAVDAAVKANEGKLQKSDFLLPQKERPYLIVSTTLIGKPHPGRRDDYFPVELTPLYSGMVSRVQDPKNPSRSFGGGFVESFAFDSRLPVQQSHDDVKTVDIGIPHFRFALSDVIAASGAAPQAFLEKHFINMIGFPEFRQWPIDGTNAERETDFGDGGHLENLGIMPLLARQVPNILAFMNTSEPFDPKVDRHEGDPLDDTIIRLFRAPMSRDANGAYTSNVVIGSGDQKLDELLAKYTDERNHGQPLVHCDRYDIVANAKYGVRPYKANICFVYVDQPKSWSNKLDRGPNRKLRRLANSSFPYFHTFFQRGTQVIRLRAADVNALSNLTAWTVITEKSTISNALGLREGNSASCLK
jgi:hypothetical protein